MMEKSRGDPGVAVSRMKIRYARRGAELRCNGQMKTSTTQSTAGALGWGLLWLIGIPIPILLVLFLLRGCT
jgi:hypothetical protein